MKKLKEILNKFKKSKVKPTLSISKGDISKGTDPKTRYYSIGLKIRF